MAKKIELREGDTLRVGSRLGRVRQDKHGDTVYKHRRGPGTSPHPQREFTSDDPGNPGGSIDWIWKAPILKMIVFAGSIFLCVWLRPMLGALIRATGCTA